MEGAVRIDEPGVKTYTDRVRRPGGGRRGLGGGAPESRSRAEQSNEEGRPARRRRKLWRTGVPDRGQKRAGDTSGSGVEERAGKRRERPRLEKRHGEASSEDDEGSERRKRRNTRELESSGEVVRDRG